MAEIFNISGDDSLTEVPAPYLTGEFYPAIDDQKFVSGYGLVVPFGAAQLIRRYGDYGVETRKLPETTPVFNSSGQQVTYNIGGDVQLGQISAGQIGTQGIQGVPGPMGPRGHPGEMGIQGLMGIPGPEGVRGPQGEQGEDGNFVIEGRTDDPTGDDLVDGRIWLRTDL